MIHQFKNVRGLQDTRSGFLSDHTFRRFYYLFFSSPESSSSEVAQVETCKPQKLIFADKSFLTKHWSGFEDVLDAPR